MALVAEQRATYLRDQRVCQRGGQEMATGVCSCPGTGVSHCDGVAKAERTGIGLHSTQSASDLADGLAFERQTSCQIAEHKTLGG